MSEGQTELLSAINGQLKINNALIIALIVIVSAILLMILLKKMYRSVQVKARNHIARELAISRVNLQSANTNNPAN
jgi:sensor domain CHASE-containing protein